MSPLLFVSASPVQVWSRSEPVIAVQCEEGMPQAALTAAGGQLWPSLKGGDVPKEQLQALGFTVATSDDPLHDYLKLVRARSATSSFIRETSRLHAKDILRTHANKPLTFVAFHTGARTDFVARDVTNARQFSKGGKNWCAAIEVDAAASAKLPGNRGASIPRFLNLADGWLVDGGDDTALPTFSETGRELEQVMYLLANIGLGRLEDTRNLQDGEPLRLVDHVGVLSAAFAECGYVTVEYVRKGEVLAKLTNLRLRQHDDLLHAVAYVLEEGVARARPSLALQKVSPDTKGEAPF